MHLRSNDAARRYVHEVLVLKPMTDMTLIVVLRGNRLWGLKEGKNIVNLQTL
jgi:hypothetical protein